MYTHEGLRIRIAQGFPTAEVRPRILEQVFRILSKNMVGKQLTKGEEILTFGFPISQTQFLRSYWSMFSTKTREASHTGEGLGSNSLKGRREFPRCREEKCQDDSCGEGKEQPALDLAGGWWALDGMWRGGELQWGGGEGLSFSQA